VIGHLPSPDSHHDLVS